MDHINNKKQKLSFVFYAILTVIIFILDILLMQRFAVWLLYVFPVAGISGKGNRKNTIIITSISTLFIFLGCFLSPLGVNHGYLVLPARILGILVLWGLTILLINKKRVESILQESEERQRIVLEAANLGTWDLDLVTDTTIRSLRHDQIWGYTEKQKEWGFEIAMKNVAAEDRHLITEAYERGVKSGLLFHENRVIWPGGSIHWIRAYGRFRYNDERKPVRVMGIVEDITERKKVEQALRNSEEKFASAFRSNPNALVLSHLDDGTILEVNETFLSFFGYSKEEVIGISSITLKMFANPEERVKAAELVRRDGKIRDYEVAIRTKSGDEKPVLLSSELMPVGGVNSILTILQDITELRQEKIKWQGIVEGIADEVWVCDANGRMDLLKLGVNSIMKLQEFKKRTLEEVLEGFEIFNLDWQPRSGEDAPLVRSLKGEIVRGEEIVRHKATGVFTYRQFTSAPMRDYNGKIIGSVAVVRDITEQKLNEQKLKETLKQLHDSEAKLLDAQRLAHVGSFTVNYGKNDYVEWSEEMFRIYGRPNEMGNPTVSEALQMIHPDDVEVIKKMIDGVKSNYQRIEVEYRIILPDDSIKYLKTIINPVMDTSGKLNMVFGTSLDITESKLTEEALRESEARLLEAEELAHVGSFSTDMQTGASDWTLETYNIYEYDQQQEPPSIDVVRSFIHPDDRDRVINAIDFGMGNNKMINIEYRLLLYGTKVKYVNYFGRPVYDSSGKPIKRAGAIMDITERKLQQQRLEEALEELQRSNRDLEQFAYVTSHDLQEPIRMIKSYTDLLAGKYISNLDQNAKEFFGFISEGSLRMQQLVSDLLKYSRISTQAKPFENIDCNEILEDVLKDLKFVILESEAVVEYDKLPVIKGDKTQIRQVFQNLIQNAIKFKNPHNPLIEIKSRRKRDFWFFSIKDNGIGIDKQYLERIFVIFQRLHTKEEYPGTGIGLAIVKKIIERHGGEIFVESEKGRGSTFFFTIPVRV